MGGYYPHPPSRYSGDRISDLIMSSGRARAEHAQRSAQIWGSALSGIGEKAAGTIQQASEAKKMAKRDAAWVSYVERGEWQQDPKAAYVKALEIWGPKEAEAQITGLVAAQKLGPRPEQTLTPEEGQKLLGQLGRSLRPLGDPVWERWWPTIGQLVKQSGLPGAELPERFSPEVRAEIEPVIDAFLAGDQANKEFTRAEERARPDVRSLDVQAADALGRGDRETYQRLLQVKREMGAASAKPTQTATLSPTAESNIVNRLSSQWTKLAAPTQEISRQVALMDVGLGAARDGDLAAGSQAVLVTFQKILDPTSVVRESEYARSAQGQALLSRLEGAFERIKSGGAGVPLVELEKYAKLAREAAKVYGVNLQATRNRLGKTADRYGIPRELILDGTDFGGGDIDFGVKPKPKKNPFS